MVVNMPMPIECKTRTGKRYFNCYFYNQCLDLAAKDMWTGFTCEFCSLKKEEELFDIHQWESQPFIDAEADYINEERNKIKKRKNK